MSCINRYVNSLYYKGAEMVRRIKGLITAYTPKQSYAHTAKQIRYRISTSPDNVFVLSDFTDLGDRYQVGRILKSLIHQEQLARIGHGLYAKTRRSSLTNEIILVKPLPELAREALNNKLNVKTYPSEAEQLYNSGHSTQVPTGCTIMTHVRVRRKIMYNNQVITFKCFHQA